MSTVSTTTLTQRREFLARAVQAEVRKAGSGSMSVMAQAKVSLYQDELDVIEHKLGGVDQLRYKDAFDNFLRVGKRALHTTDLRQLEERATIGLEGTPTGYAGPGSFAGFVAPLEYSQDVIEAAKYASPMLQVATVDETTGGNIKAYPWVNDTAVTASLITESSTLNVQDETSGLTTLAGFKISSGVVKVSLEAVQDSQVYPDLAGFLSRQFGIRFGRYLGQKSTLGVGTTEPTGYVTAASSAGTTVGANGNDGVSTAHNSIGTADFQTLQTALDYAYWVDATFQVHPTTLAILCGQLDKQGKLLWPEMQNDTQCINGKRVYANAFLSPLPATGPNSPTVSTPVLAGGSFKSVVIRTARPVFVRLDELGAAGGQVWFIAYTRVDSNLTPALSTGPVLTMSCVY